jgi:adenylylsulfate kinase-like enzyme
MAENFIEIYVIHHLRFVRLVDVKAICYGPSREIRAFTGIDDPMKTTQSRHLFAIPQKKVSRKALLR